MSLAALYTSASAVDFTIAIVLFAVWIRIPHDKTLLLASAMSASAGGIAQTELGLIKAETPEIYQQYMVLQNIFVCTMLVSMTWFLHLRLRTGRRWLAIAITCAWSVALTLSWFGPGNLTFSEVTELSKLDTFWGERFNVAQGEPHPLKIVADLTTLAIIGFIVDALVGLRWRKGASEGYVIGGSALFFILFAGVHTPLVDAGIVQTPFMISIFFSAITAALTIIIVDNIARSARSAREIEYQNRRWQALLDGIQLAIIRVDASGIITFLNPFARSVLGTRSDELLGQPVHRLTPDDEALTPLEFEQRAASGRLMNIATPTGSNRQINWFTVRLDDDAEDALDLLVFGQDVTAVKRNERELLRLRREIDTLTRAAVLGELSSSIAHELGQPIGALLSNVQSAQILRRKAGAPADEIDEIFEDLLHDVRRSAEIIQRVRQFMRNHDAKTDQFDLVRAIDDVLRLAANEAKVKNVKMSVTGVDSCRVEAGRLELQQICLNLILNSLQAMDDESDDDRRVEIAVSKAGRDVMLSVDDTGPGLPELPDFDVFKAFHSGREGGMGIGLSVCRRITEAHRGTIAAEKSPLGGARFVVRMPIGVVEQEPADG